MPLDIQNGQRTFLGEQDAAPIVRWLNGDAIDNSPGDEKERQRIGKLITDMNTSAQLFVEGKHNTALVRAIDRQLSRYTLRVSTAGVQVPSDKYKTFPDFPWQFQWDSRAGGAATERFRRLLTLAEQGLLIRVRQCPRCRRWYYARFNHQRFCGPKCQVAEYQSGDYWKLRRKRRAEEKRMQKHEQDDLRNRSVKRGSRKAR